MWGSTSRIIRNNELRHERREHQLAEVWDPHLRSTTAVSGYHIEASDGGIGHVDDFLIDSETWTVRYLVVNTRNFWPGKKVLVSPEWIERVSWEESKLFVDLSRDAIKTAPDYNGEEFFDREDESNLYQYYHKKGYWTNESNIRRPFDAHVKKNKKDQKAQMIDF